MPGRTFVSPALGEMRERPQIATPASKPHRGSGGWRDGLGTILHLGCFAIVGILTACVFFGIAFDIVAYPMGEAISTAGASTAQREASISTGSPASLPGVRADKQLAPQPAQPDPSRQPAQPAQSLVLAAALAPPPEPRRFEVDQSLAAKAPQNASAEIVSGPVTEIRDATTWVIGGQIVHLWGIRSDSRTPTPSLARLLDRVKAESPISCRRQPRSTRYRCFTATRDDIAEMALLSGVGHPASGAPVAYRAAEVLTQGKGSRH